MWPKIRALPVAIVVLVWLALPAAGEPSPTATPTASPTATQEAPKSEATAVPSPTLAPGEIDLCRNADPARALKFALSADDVIIAIVSPLSGFDVTSGISLHVDAVLEGSYPLGATKGDTVGVGTCRVEKIWAAGTPVIGTFTVLIGTAELGTLSAWPILLPDGRPFNAPSFAAGGLAAEELLVQVDGSTRLTVAELLQRGRDFVEPTPTPLPPGVTLATVVPLDVAPPDAGAGATSSNARNQNLVAALAVLAAGLALAFGAARLLYRER